MKFYDNKVVCFVMRCGLKVVEVRFFCVFWCYDSNLFCYVEGNLEFFECLFIEIVFRFLYYY